MAESFEPAPAGSWVSVGAADRGLGPANGRRQPRLGCIANTRPTRHVADSGTAPCASQELLGIAFGLVLLEHGWTMVASPGESHLVRGSESISPLEQVFGLAKGEPTTEEWVARVRDLDIASCSLSGTASPKIA